MHDYSDYGIHLNGKIGIEVSTTCPQCSKDRTKHRAPCLRVNTVKQTWFCHHCGWKGGLGGVAHTDIRPHRPNVITYHPNGERDPRLIEWFYRRGISAEVVAAHAIGLTGRYFQAFGEGDAISFPYYFEGQVVNVKYRSLDGKHFTQEKGGLKVLYGIDQLTGEIGIITEGEVDYLSLTQAGITGGLSVPDGAPAPGSKCTDLKFEYLQNCKAQLDRLTKIIIAVDNDAPGKTLEAELIRRLGPERCWRVTWPEGCKDANDVLLKHGADELRKFIDRAKPVPIKGLVRFADLADDIIHLRNHGILKGLSTGWKSLDEHYTVKPGQFTVFTGIPGHGKTEFLDALMLNMIAEHKWKFGVCSPENQPVEDYAARLLGKWNHHPFHALPTVRIAEGINDLDEHIHFIVDEDMLTIDALLKQALALVRREGINGLFIDPWTEFDHRRDNGMNETEYTGYALSRMRKFARDNNVHVFLVAHPQKLYKGKDDKVPKPGMYDISGSAAFRNKADNGICIWRNLDDEYSGNVEVHILKVRFREVGRVGCVNLKWNPVSGRYDG